jgi:hypothetical protein
MRVIPLLGDLLLGSERVLLVLLLALSLVGLYQSRGLLGVVLPRLFALSCLFVVRATGFGTGRLVCCL